MEILDLIDNEDEIATEIERADDYKEEIYQVLSKITSAVQDPSLTPSTGGATSATTAVLLLLTMLTKRKA